MASESPTELARDLQNEVATLKAQLAALEQRIESADLLGVRERLAVVESQITELKKREEENDRRRWQLWLAIGVCILTFGANLTMNLLLFYARIKS